MSKNEKLAFGKLNLMRDDKLVGKNKIRIGQILITPDDTVA